MKCKRVAFGFGLAFCSAVVTSTPLAAQNTGTLGASAEVDGSCTIVTDALNFDVLDTQTVTQVDASATVTVECTAFTVFEVSMGPGYHNSGGQRRMSNGSDFINYEVYKDNLRTQPWGLGATLTRWGVVATPGGTQDLEAYGRITGLSPATPTGSYSDQLEVIVYF